MTHASATRRWHRETTTISLALTDAPAIKFGYAGSLAPTEATVSRDVYDGREQVNVRLGAKNARGIGFGGLWGAPTPGGDDPREQGHCGYGHLDDLPADLRTALFAETGFDLLNPAQG